MSRYLPALLLSAHTALALTAGAQEAPFTVAARPWDAEQLGNHRAVVRVGAAGRAARATLRWRRPDRNAAEKGLIVTTESGTPVANVRRGPITQLAGTIDFEPAAGPGRYFVYYLPFKSGGRSNYPNVTYLPVTNTADSTWLADIAAMGAPPPATVERFESVDSLNAFWPMLVVAGDEERRQVESRVSPNDLLVFPEDRLHPIVLRDQLPFRWIARGPGGSLADTAARGEFVAFQLGVVARATPVNRVKVTFSALTNGRGQTIPASAFTSFNEGGISWEGKPFSTRVDVPAGRVQPMWCGVEIPANVPPGTWTGTAVVTADGANPVEVPLRLTVTAQVARAGGADTPWKQTRLKWLNSTIGHTNTVIRPYTPIVVSGRTLRFLGRELTLAPNGLPQGIATFFTPEMTGLQSSRVPVLRAPISFGVDDGSTRATTSGVRFTRREPGTVQWTATTTADRWSLDVRGTLEFDGSLTYETTLRARQSLDARDMALSIPYARGAATWAMGLGLKGQARPAAFSWTWDVANRNQDGAWLGGVNAGLAFSLRAENYVRPLNTNFYLQKPLLLPPSWGNAGRGTIAWREAGDTVIVRASSGPRHLAAGDSLRFDVRFLITPFHPLDTDAQWSQRYFHRFASVDSIAGTGATVVNIHHANAINPWINYPFIAHEAMRSYIADAHRRGMKVKIYNTVRELSNRAYETWALRSLGHEVFAPGKGGGYAWLQEHLVDDYIAAWFVPELKDAAIINSGMSRWHNYYAEGINWLVQRVGIDGLYLDDVAFDRTTMKRVRRLLTQDNHPGLIDLHSANQYNRNDGFINSAMLYMELFPYVDRLWFGEYFDYEANDADFYMAEVSGIPFGLMGEMLEKGGNPWRGMVYGMTNRLPWSATADPRPLWALWDAFGMQGSRMIGYWSPNVPVTTGRADVKATVYRQPGRALVSVASWASDTARVTLRVDWRALGLDPRRVSISLPEVRGLQSARSLLAGESLVIPPNTGALLVIR